MGCVVSKRKRTRVAPKRTKYILRIATYTNERGRTASAAILYLHCRHMTYDVLRHAKEEFPGILAYKIGLQLAINANATDLRVQTHMLDLLYMLKDPNFKDESIRALESKFPTLLNTFIFDKVNDDAIALCEYEATKKIEPTESKFMDLSTI